ncbi:hypothetical protein [uncultured Kordia sp.]|uniref:hypothetical protein n=1 Tax=uncultured Kordia sp. TaxID=507699 RepID=UPI0026037E28|nr:hypothetical protein [uncultured Kordia sp.]
MKKIILFCIASIILFSCSKKEQYYGTWYVYGHNGLNPVYLKIDADSIYLSKAGSYWNSFPVKITNNSLHFAGQTFSTSIFKDSIIFNGNRCFKETIYSPLEIKLPNIKSESAIEIHQDANMYYISYGKKPNTNESAFLLNDKYGSFSDIKHFISSSTSCSGGEYDPPHTLFICDKNTSTRDLEKFFLELQKVDSRTLYTVNSIDYKVFKDSIKSISTQQEQKLSLIYNANYDQKVNGKLYQPRMHSGLFYSLNDFTFEEEVYAFLIKNEFYYEKEKYTYDAFSDKIEKAISQHKILIVLFDLESDYKHYLQFNDAVNSEYIRIRENASRKTYNVSYKKLNKKQRLHINSLHPKKVIQNISIPHFLSFEETPIEDLDFPFKNVKEQIPEVYFQN